jgi:hypothetical protein
MGKFITFFRNNKRRAISAVVGFFGIVFWLEALRISSNLRPIADEICVLGDWSEGDLLPSLHISPRLLSTLFTWGSSILWSENYQVAIIFHFALAYGLVAIILKKLVILKGVSFESNRQFIYQGMILTSWLLFALPPSLAGLYDTSFWFGGTWYVVGGLGIISMIFTLVSEKSNIKQKVAWIIAASAWNELSAGLVVITLFILVITKKANLRNAVTICTVPFVFLMWHAVHNLSSGRLTASRLESDTNLQISIKSILKIFLEYSITGLIIGMVLATLLPFSSTITRNHSKRHYLGILLIGPLFVFVISLIAYPTWRSSYIIGLLIAFFYPLLRNYRRRLVPISSVVAIFFISLLGLYTVQNLETLQDSTANRLDWWNSIVRMNDGVLSFPPPPNKPVFSPADIGTSGWIDLCFKSFAQRGEK